MCEVRFVDTTVRDANQSLWDATGIKTGMILSIASVMDRVGFKAIDFITGTHIAFPFVGIVRTRGKKYGLSVSLCRRPL